MYSFQPAIRIHRGEEASAPAPASRVIGELIRELRPLTDKQIEQTLAYQGKTGMRFGEAAVALRLVERNDVLEALSRQFQYQYTPGFAGRELSSELVTATDPFGEQADAFRELRSRLLVEVLDPGASRALAVLSPDVGDGKTYLAANLAVSLSQLGERTLLVDADIHTPRQHKLFGLERNGVGLSGVLAGLSHASALVHEVRGLPNLCLAPAGAVPPNALELLQRPVFGQVVRDLLDEFAHVVVDTPAGTRGADARVIAARCGAALVVARKGRSRMAPLEGLLGSLSRGPARIAGVVMNEH
jgi:protein-tyrosine kinase